MWILEVVMVGSTDFFEINLHDGDGNVLLGIDDGNTGQKLVFDIVNTSDKTIYFNKVEGFVNLDEINIPKNFHFSLLFRPKTLLSSSINKITLGDQEIKDGWVLRFIKREEKASDKYDIFYIANSQGHSLLPGDRITFTLNNISAAPDGGARGTRVEIKYNNFIFSTANIDQSKDNKNEDQRLNILSGNCLKNLNILNKRGKKQIPLYVDFIGSSTILNDGSENNLTLSIQLLPRLDVPLEVKKHEIPSDLSKLSEEQTKILDITLQKVLPLVSKLLSRNDITKDKLKEGVQYFLKANDNEQQKQNILWELYSQLNAQNKTQNFVNDLFNSLKEEANIKPDAQFVETAIFFLKTIGFESPSLDIIKFLNLNLNNERILTLRGKETLDQQTKFTISFDVATNDSGSMHWALVNKTDADAISCDIHDLFSNNWEKQFNKQGITPQWTFTCKTLLPVISFQEILRLNISKIKTTLLAGYANLYVHYENIPGYWDGHITVPIQKGPLVYREYPNVGSPNGVKNQPKVGCIGIGTDKPQAKLHINLNKDNENIPSLQIPALIVDGLTILNQKIQTTNLISVKLNGSSFNTTSDEFKRPYVEVNGQKKVFETQISQPRLFTQIIKPDGSLLDPLQHDTYGGEWNKWAKDVQQKANDGHMVAVVSFDAIGKPLSTDQDAINLLTSINARKILNYPYITTDPLTKRIPYALIFIKGKNESIEVLNYDSSKNKNAFIDTSYEKLLSLSTLTVNGTVNATKFVGEGACVSGMIMMWSGMVSNIPSSWALCDGRNGTPNLTERFIVAAGGQYQPHNSGNADTHQHKINILTSSGKGGRHFHTLELKGSSWEPKRYFQNGPDHNGIDIHESTSIDTQEVVEHDHEINIKDKLTEKNEGENRPKWYALCFIMKI